MPAGPSGFAITPVSPPGQSILKAGPSVPPKQPIRRPNPGAQPRVAQIRSTPQTRTGSPVVTLSTGEEITLGDTGQLGGEGSEETITFGDGSTVQIGQTPDVSQRDQRINAAVTEVQGSAATGALTPAEQVANLEATQQRGKNALGCISRGAGGGGQASPDCGDPCDTAECLKDLVFGNLDQLGPQAKELLCGILDATERSVQQQVANTGYALTRAAQELSSAQAARAQLREVASFLNGIDPGAIARCFGAQELKDRINGELRKADTVIRNAEAGVNDAIADKFNEGVEKASQLASIDPGLC